MLNVTDSPFPHPTVFFHWKTPYYMDVNTPKEQLKLYFRGNPWKGSCDEIPKKIFKYCIGCGEQRFNEEAWSNISSRIGKSSSAICNKSECKKTLEKITEYVPECFLSVSEFNEIRFFERNKEKEFYTAVDEEIYPVRCERVFPSYDKTPNLFLFLENIPLSQRLLHIPELFYSYTERKGLLQSIHDENISDPFLKKLSDYYKKNLEIMKSAPKYQCKL